MKENIIKKNQNVRSKKKKKKKKIRRWKKEKKCEKSKLEIE